MALGPYASAALVLWGKGWRGVLPVPAGQKSPPPEGWTGAAAPMPGYGDVFAWVEDRPGWNVALRLPEGLVGIDVDAYGSKAGAATLAALEDRWGPLPPTWRITSRDDGTSGIRLYRVPDGLRWPGELGPGVEIVQRRHRYAMAPPSVHPEGRVYRWLDPELGPDEAPSPDVPTWMPESWIDGATSGELAVDLEKTHVPRGVLAGWLRDAPGGGRCRQTAAAVARHALETTGGASRHDATLRAVMHLSRLAAEGHTGVTDALGEVERRWTAAVAADGSRSAGQAEAEWGRMLAGAVGVVLGGPPATADPCTDPFADIRGHLPALVARGTPGVAGPELPRTPGEGPTTPRVGSDGWQASGHVHLPGVISGDHAEGDVTRPVTPDPAASGGMSDTEAMRAAWVAQELERLRARRGAETALRAEEHARSWTAPPSWDLPTLLAAPPEPVRFVVEQLVPECANVLITAQFKAGKTTTVLNLTKALADGKPFLGSFGCTPGEGSVAIWNYEVGEAMFTAWLRDLAIEHPERVVGMNLRGRVLPFLVPEVVDWAVEWLLARRAAHWLLDPWGRAISGSDENSNSEVGRILEILDDIKERAGVRTLIIPAHTGRVLQAFGAERARGASRLDDWADVRWVLTTDKEGKRYFRAHGRDVDVEEGELQFDPIMRSLTYAPGGRDPEDDPITGAGRTRTRRPARNTQDELVRLVGERPGLSANALADEAGGNRKATLDGLRALVSQGVVHTRAGARRERLHYLPGHPDLTS